MKNLTKYLVRRSMIQEGKEITLKEEERTAAQFSAEWALVEATGWTLEYIRSMDPHDFRKCLSIMKTKHELSKPRKSSQ